MKKLLISLLTITSTYAATTGTINLSGIIPVILNISVSTLPVASNLTLSSAASNLKIAAVSELSNSSTGYDVFVSSLNAGKLKRTGSAHFINYTVTYGSLTNTTLTASNISAVSQAVLGTYSVTRDFGISYAAVNYNTTVAGTYTDVITLTIQAK